MNEKINNNDKNELRNAFIEENIEYKNLFSSVNHLKIKVTDINNKIISFNNSIIDSKKIDNIIYSILTIMVVAISSIGLLSSTGFSNILVGIGVLSLSIPFVSLIQTATYRFQVRKIISELNSELCNYKVSLKEEEKKLLDIKNDMINNFYNLIDNELSKEDKHMVLCSENKSKKYEKPYIRIKKINS